MKKFFILAVIGLNILCIHAQKNVSDPVIITINGKDVPRSEFEYSFNKNNSEGVIDKKSIEEYVELFINYKLKVQAAIDAKLDTATSYKKEFLSYRDQQLYPSFVTDAEVEQEALNVYNRTKESIGPDGLIKPAHILLYLPQDADNSVKETLKLRADSIYNAILTGASFEEMAKKFSGDHGSALEGGVLPWLSKGQTLKEFEDVAFKLNVGEMSQPVLSPVGYHIILLKEKKQFEAYEELHDQILKFLEARNTRESIAKRNIDTLATQKGVSSEEILNTKADELVKKDDNMKYLIQEYHDGLLLYEISNRTIWDAAAKDTVGLEEFFEHNKKKYAWDRPRYKGIAYHTRDKADVKEVKKVLKKLPFSEWAVVLKNTFNNDSILRIRAEKGIFKKGDNKFIDKMIFKDKSVQPKTLKDYPFDGVYGQLLKNGPEEYLDVKSLVVADYQEVLEKEWIADLRSKYSFSVNQDVLKTVNKH